MSTMMEPLAIVGFSFTLPQGLNDEASLWEALMRKRSLMTDWPDDRANMDAFHGPGAPKVGSLSGRGGHFMNVDPWSFDAPFFSLTAKEAAAMDPQQRLIMETAYHAFENAGMTVESLKGSRTAVYEASMSDDYAHMYAKDPDNAPLSAATGTTASIRANRVSWYFSLEGPSLHVDTACSSSLIAMELAAQAISTGEVTSALVIGCNLMLSPEMSVLMSSMNFLSPDSLSYSFDHRANGYSRGEGFIGLVMKPLASALSDGNIIRAIIRSIGSNQDGHTPFLTQPSTSAQEKLIRQVYEKAGLDFSRTRYIEAHGTGTPTGDPIEMKAIGRVFRSSRSENEPLYVGSVKANIGHLEGGSGLAGVVKAIMILEKAIIPPNALFEEMNPDIDWQFFHTVVPTESVPWPGPGLRRVSVNSFGIGGTNAHIILDDAFHFLEAQNLHGHHNSVPSPIPLTKAELVAPYNDICACTSRLNRIPRDTSFNGQSDLASVKLSRLTPVLFVMSAADENAIQRVAESLKSYIESKALAQAMMLYKIASKLASRTHMPWRTYAIGSLRDGVGFHFKPTKAQRASSSKQSAAFVFPGQGAQYAGMGRGLLRYRVFAAVLRRVDGVLSQLGCHWSIFDELDNEETINLPEFSQPLCTALQIGQFELLKSFGIVPIAVVGHSSGEIAAAYASGALTLENACKIAFFRGQVAAYLKNKIALSQEPGSAGSMVSVGLSPEEVEPFLKSIHSSQSPEGSVLGYLQIACINSPRNCTVSGTDELVTKLQLQLELQNIFARKLNTGGIAYHSQSLQQIAAQYLHLLDCHLEAAPDHQKNHQKANLPMFSSVTGHRIEPELLSKGQYWVDNLVSPVQFLDAVVGLIHDTQSRESRGFSSSKAKSNPLTDLIELGPYGALRRPLADILTTEATKHGWDKNDGTHRTIRYHSALSKSRDGIESTLQLVGSLYCHGYPVSDTEPNSHCLECGASATSIISCHSDGDAMDDDTSVQVFQNHCSTVTDLPKYPFERSRRYCNEPRISREYRMRSKANMASNSCGELLGRPAIDWNPLEPRWRNIIATETIPWLAHHVVNNTTVLPGTAMLAMAIEAASQYVTAFGQPVPATHVRGFLVKSARFSNPIIVNDSMQGGTETVLCFRPMQFSQSQQNLKTVEIKLYALHDSTRWSQCMQCELSIELESQTQPINHVKDEMTLQHGKVVGIYNEANKACVTRIDSNNFYNWLRDHVGVEYGESFRILQNIRWDGQDTATASVCAYLSTSPDVTPSIRTRRPLAAVLDSAVHLILTQISKGLSGSKHTLVLQEISNMWITAQPWDGPNTGSVSDLRFVSTMKKENDKTGNSSCAILALSNDNKLYFNMEHVHMAAVARTNSYNQTQIRQNIIYGIDWQPKLSLMSKTQLLAMFHLPPTRTDYEEFMQTFFPKIELAMIGSVRKTLVNLAKNPLKDNSRPWISTYVNSLQTLYGIESKSCGIEHTSECTYELVDWRQAGLMVDDQDLEAIWQSCEEEHPNWEMFPIVARNLEAIIRGQIDPLHLVFTGGLVEKFYASLFAQICDERFQKVIDLLCHERSSLSVLEVGAGTGGMTNHVLSAFQDTEHRKGITCFREYTYTDISPAFFERSKEMFKSFNDRMKFKTLNLELDAHLEQGFELGAYDLVVASSVIHATRRIEATLRNLRQLLKPGGYLLFLEIVDPNTSCGNAGFGIFSGWWLSGEEWRSNSPLITETQWNDQLINTGFSGTDLVLRDFESDKCHLSSIMLSRRIVEDTSPVCHDDSTLNIPLTASAGERIVILIDSESKFQASTAQAIEKQKSAGGSVDIVSLSSLSAEGSDSQLIDIIGKPTTLTISLLEMGSPLLVNLTEDIFDALKILMLRVGQLVWVTATSLKDPEYPQYGAVTGFIRTLRSESVNKHFVVISMEYTPSFTVSSSVDSQKAAQQIWRIVLDTFGSDMSVLVPSEFEYTIKGDLVCTSRLVEEPSVSQKLRRLVTPERREEPWSLSPTLKLDISVPGSLDTFVFTEDESYNRSIDIAAGEVEVQTAVWPLSFRDLFVALGRMEYDILGLECAGTVTRVGPSLRPQDCSTEQLQPGDRVCVGTLHGGMRAYVRESEKLVVKLPDTLSFETAASSINPGVTAYHALVNLARLQKNETLLIHSAAGSTGQMAICLAKMIGAEIFATVGNQEKKQLLIDKFGIPADHILYSRDALFLRTIKRVTGGRGVDVVLNSLSGESLRASWECVAPFGRFVEIGKADILSNNTLPMGGFQKNVSFFALDLHHVAAYNPDLMSSLMRNVIDLLARGVINHPQPLHMYSTSEVEQAFRFMQTGKNTGRILIIPEQSAPVTKLIRDKQTCRFNPNASYLIVGGLGGLGRAILRWMASRGARYFIVPSRSGLSTSATAATNVVEELRQQGLKVLIPKCDVSSLDALSAMLEECPSILPPIRGCINAAMVLQDSVFDNMTLAQWRLTMESKATSSSNLHHLLPIGSLDFFILLSSLSGIYGSLGQSNYAAGCTFQDALARQRASKGDNAIALDIGWMKTIGIIAETEEYQRNREHSGDMAAIEADELLALLSLCCDPSNGVANKQLNPLCIGSSGGHHQILIGAVTPANYSGDQENLPSLLQRPLFSGFQRTRQGRGHHSANGGMGGSNDNDPALDFKRATSTKSKAEVVVQALSARLARALTLPITDIESDRPMFDFGIDSLMAVELRNWIGRDFQANLAVFDIMGGATIAGLGALVVERTKTNAELIM